MRESKDLLLTKGNFILQKMNMKGGWTYAEMPGIKPSSDKPFGWVKVKGTIDGHPIHAYHLMPMGNGNLFLPVKASIRKKIKKEEGDPIYVELYQDEVAFEMPLELLDCLEPYPELFTAFQAKTDSEKERLVKWIYEPKMIQTKEKRILDLIEQLEKELK